MQAKWFVKKEKWLQKCELILSGDILDVVDVVLRPRHRFWSLFTVLAKLNQTDCQQAIANIWPNLKSNPREQIPCVFFFFKKTISKISYRVEQIFRARQSHRAPWFDDEYYHRLPRLRTTSFTSLKCPPEATVESAIFERFENCDHDLWTRLIKRVNMRVQLMNSLPVVHSQ